MPLDPAPRPACPSCGYRRGEVVPDPDGGRPGYDCPICWHAGFAPGEAPAQAVATPARLVPTSRAPSRGLGALVAGLLAFPTGLGLFFGHKRIKRYLLPPLALSTVIFSVLIFWTRAALAAWLDRSLAAEGEDVALTSLDPGWWRSSLEWLLNDAYGVELLRGSTWVLFAVLAWVLAWYTFSLVYELLAGPFLDEVHGIVEERWFGIDPRKDLDRPTDLDVAICARTSWLLGSVGALAFALAFLSLSWPWVLLAFALLLAPFAAAMVPGGLPGLPHGREYARWLRWVAGVESRSLWIGLEMSLVSLVFLIGFLWLNLVPLVGPFLYAGMVGLGTAIGMLDLPLERRGWSLGQRLGLLTRHPLPVVAFGVVTGAAFAVPVIGPMLSVPAASLGALWLICRLDTGPIRS